MRKFFTAVLMAVIVALAVVGVKQIQQPKLDDLQGQESVLKQQISEAEDKLAAVKAAGEIKTDGWLQYCDPQSTLCFKYPKEWAFVGGTPNQFKYVGAMVTSPDKSLIVNYINPVVKDSGPGSAHVVKKTDLVVVTAKLVVIGSYPVSFGKYQPNWAIMSGDFFSNVKAGTVATIAAANPVFDAGKASGVSLRANGPTFESAAQAEAWFDSVDGKTLQAVLGSLSLK